MNLFRRLTAEIPGELLAAQVAATNRDTEIANDIIRGLDDTARTLAVLSASYATVFATLAVLADNPGVLTGNTPGLPAPANPTERP